MLSIIVPIYKIEDFIANCIESILLQTYSDFELILVDDGSTDRCAEICEEYALKDSRIIVLHKKNFGLVSARKAGLRLAVGDYIGYVDGDDWIEKEYYYRMMSTALQYNVDIVASGFIKDIGDNCTNKLNSIKSGLYTKSEINTEIVQRMMYDDDSFEPGLFTYLWNKVFKKEALFKSQMSVLNEISLGEDAACLYPAVLNSESLCIIDDCLYHYRQRADSMLKISDNYQEDIICYSQLYNQLSLFCKENLLLEKQLDSFLLYLITTRCGGVLAYNDEFEWYLYDREPNGNNLAIYGAGTLGQHLVKRIKASGRYSIVRWVDSDYEVLRQHNLNVNQPDSIFDINYDSVLISFFNHNIANRIKVELINMGIPEDKIIITDFHGVEKRKILKKFGVLM